jgi:hypothetical protein
MMILMTRQLTIFFCLLVFSLKLYSQPRINIVFTDKPPVINGKVDDDSWINAATVTDLIQKEPHTGEAVSEKTEFRFLFDHNNIYVGIICHDQPGGITAKELARDVSLGEDDRVQIIFDTFLDGRNGYWFQIGPRGSIGDALIGENGKDFNKSWDGIWDGKARITDAGWEAELIIPFKTMGFKKDLDTWGLKIIRHIKRKSESSYWPETSLNADKFSVADAGRMTGIANITQGIGLDVVPYLTAGAGKKKNADPKSVFEAGLDAFYQITPSMKASVTVNTDFAQTEVDERQINLTRFNLYFPEKRDFFLEGSNFFTFGINGDREDPMATQIIPFFSRRIGLDSLGNPVQIRYGGKFTGKAGKFNIGMLHVKDDNAWDNPGYSTGRVTYNFGKQSSIGLIGTAGNAMSDRENSTVGMDLHLSTSKFKGNRNVIFNMYGSKSFTTGLTGNDISFGTEINYPNDFLNFRLGYLQIGRDYTAGLGFVPRKDIRDLYGSFMLGPRPKNSAVLQVKTGVKFATFASLSSGRTESSQLDFNYSDIIFISGDLISAASQYQYESLTKGFNIFDTIVILADDYGFWRHSVTLTSAKRRNLWVSAKFAAGTFYSGTRTDLLLQTGYKVCVPLYLGIESDRRWVNLKEGDFIAQIFRLNLNILFGPNMTWYNFAQYDNQSEKIGWQSRFQWIIKPGKEIFVTLNSPSIDPMERFKPEVYDARVKVKYTIRF